MGSGRASRPRICSMRKDSRYAPPSSSHGIRSCSTRLRKCYRDSLCCAWRARRPSDSNGLTGCPTKACSCRWSRARYSRPSRSCSWNWWRRAALRWDTGTSSTSYSSIGASSGYPISRSGRGWASISSIGSRSRFRSTSSSRCVEKDWPGRVCGKRTSQAEFDELPRLHDGRQTAAVLSEDADVRERIAIDDQYIGMAARLDLAELRLQEDLGIDGGRRAQDGGGRLHFPPDGEFASLMSVKMPEEVRSKTDL